MKKKKLFVVVITWFTITETSFARRLHDSAFKAYIYLSWLDATFKFNFVPMTSAVITSYLACSSAVIVYKKIHCIF